MTKTQQFWHRVHELTNFCLANRGKCFENWPEETVFFYVAFHVLSGTIFVVKAEDEIKAVGFAWTSSHANLSVDFAWRLPTPGDCLMVMEVIGERKWLGSCLLRAQERWPQVRRFFAWRHDKLVELSRREIERFCLKGAFV